MSRVGKICRYSNPVNDAERLARFVIVEDNGNRLLITPAKSNLPFPPVELVSSSDVEITEEDKTQ